MTFFKIFFIPSFVKTRIIAWELNGNIFLALLLTYLDEKMVSASSKKPESKNRAEQQNKAIIFHRAAFDTKTKIKLNSG